MKNLCFFAVSVGALVLLSACHSMQAQSGSALKSVKNQTVIYFNPTVFPDIEEIREPTYSAFFTAVTERVERNRNYKMMKIDDLLSYDSVDAPSVKQYCAHNNAAFAVVPKVKYFKVGFGKYVFSNQVVVSLKLYDAHGRLVAESDYDTYKKKARMLGSAENSIKIGTEGAMKLLGKTLRQSKVSVISFSDNN